MVKDTVLGVASQHCWPPADVLNQISVLHPSLLFKPFRALRERIILQWRGLWITEDPLHLLGLPSTGEASWGPLHSSF